MTTAGNQKRSEVLEIDFTSMHKETRFIIKSDREKK
jgi:hypothetical protein